MALTLVDAPIALITTLPFAILMYFITGLQRTAAQFFIFYLYVLPLSHGLRRHLLMRFPLDLFIR